MPRTLGPDIRASGASPTARLRGTWPVLVSTTTALAPARGPRPQSVCYRDACPAGGVRAYVHLHRAREADSTCGLIAGSVSREPEECAAVVRWERSAGTSMNPWAFLYGLGLPPCSSRYREASWRSCAGRQRRTRKGIRSFRAATITPFVYTFLPGPEESSVWRRVGESNRFLARPPCVHTRTKSRPKGALGTFGDHSACGAVGTNMLPHQDARAVGTGQERCLCSAITRQLAIGVQVRSMHTRAG